MDDPSLREEVQSLIASHDEPTDLLEKGALDGMGRPHLDEEAGGKRDAAGPPEPTTARAASLEGQRLGPYRVLQEIGHGGMGAVYRAVRDDDQFKKRVAIKVLLKGMDTDDIVRRFRNERQILAGIDHAHIAKLYDGGTTEGGRPYFVMELIEGNPIDAYSDTHRLSITERLKLFRKVCSAVHFAHQNLVVHRDLKPGNILVTAEGEPKLLDFGIAKLLNPELSSSTIDPTRFQFRLMTPEYASPEQVRGETITTASDVYSLGVLLYELLTGHRPYRLKSHRMEEITRVICEEEPIRPSTVIEQVEEVAGPGGTTRKITAETVSKTREGSKEKLRGRLKGDLDNIILMAMRKEPLRRYASVEQLSEDIQRVLEGLPVKAHKATLTYRSSKFLRRHKAAVGAAAAVLVALLGFTTFTVRERSRAERARDRAESEAAKAKATNEFLQEMLGSANPYEGAGRVTVLEVLADAVEKIDEFFGDQLEIKAAVQSRIGVTYLRLGLYDEAEPLLRSALEVRKDAFGEQHLDVSESVNNLAELHYQKGDYEAAEPLFREALVMRRKLFGKEHPDVAESVNNLAALLEKKGDYEVAEPLYREGLAMERKLRGDEHPAVAINLNNLALLLQKKGDYEAAEPLFREALVMDRKLLGDEHPAVARSLNDLANLLKDKGDCEAAEPFHKEACNIFQKALGLNHWRLSHARSDYSACLIKLGRYEQAEGLLLSAYPVLQTKLGERHERTQKAVSRLVELYEAWGKPEKAAEYQSPGASLP